MCFLLLLVVIFVRGEQTLNPVASKIWKHLIIQLSKAYCLRASVQFLKFNILLKGIVSLEPQNNYKCYSGPGIIFSVLIPAE